MKSRSIFLKQARFLFGIYMTRRRVFTKVLFDKGQSIIEQMLENADKLSIEKLFNEWEAMYSKYVDDRGKGVRLHPSHCCCR